TAADPRKFLTHPVVGREKADDRAVAIDGVEIVLAVEDDVLGAFDPAQRNRLGVLQPVIFREPGAAAAGDRGRGLEIDPARRNIDLLKYLALVLDPLDVEPDRGEEDDTDHRRC